MKIWKITCTLFDLDSSQFQEGFVYAMNTSTANGNNANKKADTSIVVAGSQL